MGTELLRPSIRERFKIEERGHAVAILSCDFPTEFTDIQDCLDQFCLRKTEILTPGGSKSPIAKGINGFFANRGWDEKTFDVSIHVDGEQWPCPTHGIDYFKNRIGIEVEWNNKDPFFDRDLNTFRLLHQLGILSVGAIITRTWELEYELRSLGKGKSYGSSTTHFGKLLPKVNGGGAGGCPLLLIGLGLSCYDRSL